MTVEGDGFDLDAHLPRGHQPRSLGVSEGLRGLAAREVGLFQAVVPVIDPIPEPLLSELADADAFDDAGWAADD